MLFVDLISQINRIACRNEFLINQSWSNVCSWETKSDLFCKGELQLVFNTDGAPVFKSNKLSVWPLWVQIYNLPPVLRSSYANICLMGLWYGESKPDFNKLLLSVSAEFENISKGAFLKKLGFVKFRFRSIVCDAPATAYVLCMKQHMGYESCAYCFIKGFHQNRRMLFKVSKAFFLREHEYFVRCGELAEQQKSIVHGIKSQTPLNKFFNFPWDCPIDPMHQVFLGTGKVLSKFLISLAKGNSLTELQKRVLSCMVPFDIQHRTRKITDINYWKAFDFKLFFFHIGPLVFFDLGVSSRHFLSFCRLSFSIRLLSDAEFCTNNLEQAEFLIAKFFENFVDLFGTDSQSYNFHTMRHLVEQVRRNGPLWLFSAFCFESANHQLLSALSGTIKYPEKMVDRFLRHQISYGDFLSDERESKVHLLEAFTKLSYEVKDFCREKNIELVFARYFNDVGKKFCSTSYTRLNGNMSECFFQLKDSNFVKVECYAKIESTIYAVVKQFLNVRELKIVTDVCKPSLGYCFELSDLGPLKLRDVKTFAFKTVVFPCNNDSFRVSVLKEGFEHN